MQNVISWGATKSSKDLVTPDGLIVDLQSSGEHKRLATVKIEDISPAFIGYQIAPRFVSFNLKSTLAQLGINGIALKYELDRKHHSAQIQVEITAIGNLARAMLDLLTVGSYIGKLFAADPKRLVKHSSYLTQMIGEVDNRGRPLFCLGNPPLFKEIENRAIAFLPLLPGTVTYETTIYGLLPTLAKALCHPSAPIRDLLPLHQRWNPSLPLQVRKNELLLVRTKPLHLLTVYARVVHSLLPQGFHHTTASILQPDTHASGDIYEFYGDSKELLREIPLEFYSLETVT